MRRISAAIKRWIAGRLIHHLSRRKLSDPIAAKNQQIADLQRELNALRLGRAMSPNAPLSDQLIASLQPTALARPAPVPDVAPEPEPPASMPAQAMEPVASMPAQAMEPVESPEPTPSMPDPEPLTTDAEPAMIPQTPQTEAVPPTPAAQPSAPRTTLPDVKMLAPVLKIALATLSIEQMVEIGLHVKMGAPGFREFLDSDVAKTKFRELYATYCDFLAGKVK